MSLIFLSHSSGDSRQALALKKWLEEQRPELANEIFLDIDPQTGLRLGGQWGSQLVTSNSRCEYLICLVSRQWLDSRECLVEFRTAEGFGKRILVARLQDTGDDDITSRWQRCDLFADGVSTTVDIPGGPPVAFNAAALDQLKKAIEGTGIGPENFVWPPRDHPPRAPYRGWEPFQDIDAGVFFGRDAAIAKGLDELRAMRFRLLAELSGRKSLFVVLGPSGSGKSSFLRAGLIPRLQRDDRRFVVLGVMRPERNALTGEHGLAAAIEGARTDLRLPAIALGDIKSACLNDPDRVNALLLELRTAAYNRFLATDAVGHATNADPSVDTSGATEPVDGQDNSAPTLVLPLDQAEELFSADAGGQAAQFLTLIADMLRRMNATDLGLIVAVTIRTDRFEAMQNHPGLEGLDSGLFDELKPMPPAEFRQVITGPAGRAREGGQRLTIAPDLVNRLLADAAEGADTLPLLALTMAKLYTDYAQTGELTLANYEAMGGMRSVVKSTVDEILSPDPAQRDHQLDALRAAFIPWLATINPDNDQPMRRVARESDLPADSLPLINALVEKRLLVRDERDGQTVIEVALESLLRQWDDLADWLGKERQNLKAADDIERSAAAWAAHDRDPAWLLTGTRLGEAEILSTTTGFRERLAASLGYLTTSREVEDRRLAKEEEQRQGQLRLARTRARLAVLVAVIAIIGAVAASIGFVQANRARHQADARSREAVALKLTSQGEAMLAGVQGGGDVRAIQEIAAAPIIAPTTDLGGLLTAVMQRRSTVKIIPTPNPDPAVAFSPDGRRIASVGSDHALRLWDADTGQLIGQPMTGHSDTVYGVAFSPDGHYIVSGSSGVAGESRNNNLRLWNADTGEQIGQAFTSNVSGVDGVAFNPDGHLIVSGHRDGTVRLWNAHTGQQIGQPLTGHSEMVNSVAFSPDGQRIVSGGSDNTVRLWDVNTGRELGAPIVPAVVPGQPHQRQVLGGDTASDQVNSVAFSPDGHRIVSGDDDGTLRLWNADTGQPIGAPLTGHQGLVASVAFSPDGRRIVSGGGDGTLRLWDPATGKQIGQPFTSSASDVNSVAFGPDGHRIASSSGDGTLRIWDADTANPMTGHTDDVKSVAFSPDGHRIVSGSDDKSVRLWDADTGKPIGQAMIGSTKSVVNAVFSSDGRRVVSTSADGTVRVWDANTGQPIGQPVTVPKRVLALSPDGHHVVSSDEGHTLRVSDAESGQPIGQPMTGVTKDVNTAAFSPDGHRVVSASDDDALRLWNADTGQLIGAPMKAAEQGPVNAVAFSPDGHRIVAGDADGKLLLWDTDTGKLIGQPFTGHSNAVFAVAFSPDGLRLVSTSNDGTVRLWDIATRQQIGPPLTGHHGPVTAVAFSPNGQRIVSGGGKVYSDTRDFSLRLWPGPAAWPDALCKKLTANMSPQQWHDWVSPDLAYTAVCPGLQPGK